MVEVAPSVALLFDDAGLGEQLRSALQERGARIVHEGALAGLTRELLASIDADVLVVNLDDEDDQALDRLDDALGGERPRVVFNDGQASRQLEGWDRARWARHLAMKVLAMGDADPPRPPAPPEAVFEEPSSVGTLEEQLAAAAVEMAPKAGEEARQSAVSETLAAELEALLAADVPVEASTAALEAVQPVPAPAKEPALAHADAGELDISAELTALLNGEAFAPRPDHGETMVADDASSTAPVTGAALAMEAEDETFDVTRELEALLAAGLPAGQADEFGNALHDAAGERDSGHALSYDATLPLAAGEAEQPMVPSASADELPVAFAMDTTEPSPVVESPVRASFQLDHLELAPVDAELPASSPRADAAELSASRVSDSWTLYDHDTPAPAASVERLDPAEFGIQKLSAADYLAPDAGELATSPILPGLSLELVSMEEAVAPQSFEPSHEMILDLPANLLPRLVVLGATTESTASVGEFLAALPTGLQATILHTQHLAGRPADGLVQYFASQCALPVREAERGMRARIGEVIVVPSDRQVLIRRDGTVELKPIEPGTVHAPSIDASFTDAAGAFGRDVTAIVFAGRSTDAVGGCQAVFDRGGKVWVEATGAAQPADMVSGVLAEHLSHQAGTPRELAARLAEQFSEGQS